MVRLHSANKRKGAASSSKEKTTTTTTTTTRSRPDHKLQRTDTILEMTRWKEEEDSSLVDILIGEEEDEDSPPEDPLLLEKEKEPPVVPGDVDAYMARREMTKHQERWNALTMIPSPLYCFYYILNGKWLSNAGTTDAVFMSTNDLDESSCIHSMCFPHLHAMPPLTVMFVALGIALHAPFSFLYHWKYAHALPPGIARTDHLSRRLDQAMIHVASAFIAYATSASWHYFLANVLYNSDCWRRHIFQKEVRILTWWPG